MDPIIKDDGTCYRTVQHGTSMVDTVLPNIPT
jgi:hypothetical protein